MMNFSNLKVLVIGDICLDVIEEGIATRISPEAPVPVILNPKTKYSLGMAGNVALNLKNLGAEVYLETIIADDFAGNKINKLVKENNIKFNIEIAEVNRNNRPITTTKKRIFANNQQVARIDSESNNWHNDSIIKLSKIIFDYGPNYFDLVIISDYNKGVISNSGWNYLLEALEYVNSGEFYVDTKKKDVISFYEGMILFPNTNELNNIMEFYKDEDFSINDLRIELDTPFIVETASEMGAFIHDNKNKYHGKQNAKEVIDVTGAGDTFISAFSLFYTKFHNEKRALDFANHCCSKVIQKKGTTSITYKEALEYDYKNFR